MGKKEAGMCGSAYPHLDSRCADPVLPSKAHSWHNRRYPVSWSLEEVAYYLGHSTKSGMPTIQTTIRYTQVSREHVKEKLKLLRG